MAGNPENNGENPLQPVVVIYHDSPIPRVERLFIDLQDTDTNPSYVIIRPNTLTNRPKEITSLLTTQETSQHREMITNREEPIFETGGFILEERRETGEVTDYQITLIPQLDLPASSEAARTIIASAKPEEVVGFHNAIAPAIPFCFITDKGIILEGDGQMDSLSHTKKPKTAFSMNSKRWEIGDKLTTGMLSPVKIDGSLQGNPPNLFRIKATEDGIFFEFMAKTIPMIDRRAITVLTHGQPQVKPVSLWVGLATPSSNFDQMNELIVDLINLGGINTAKIQQIVKFYFRLG